MDDIEDMFKDGLDEGPTVRKIKKNVRIRKGKGRKKNG